MNDVKQGYHEAQKKRHDKIMDFANNSPCPVFEPSDLLPVLTGNAQNSTSRHPMYRTIVRTLNGMHEAGYLGKFFCYGTNQSVYWSKDRLK